MLISLQDQKGVKIKKEKNLAKCLDQILLLTKLKEKRSLGTDVDGDKEKEGKVKLISINR